MLAGDAGARISICRRSMPMKYPFDISQGRTLLVATRDKRDL
jgi:hypothetical protein